MQTQVQLESQPLSRVRRYIGLLACTIQLWRSTCISDPCRRRSAAALMPLQQVEEEWEKRARELSLLLPWWLERASPPDLVPAASRASGVAAASAVAVAVAVEAVAAAVAVVVEAVTAAEGDVELKSGPLQRSRPLLLLLPQEQVTSSQPQKRPLCCFALLAALFAAAV